jgi:tryptophan 2,3-dioxygenase
MTQCPFSVAADSGAGADTPPAPKSEYASYMRTDELLALQRADAELLHRDERLFQCVHQSTELWLKQAHFEIDHAITLINAGRIATAAQVTARASDCITFVTEQLEILTRMSSLDFGVLRPALGQGSGLESPGWSTLRKSAPRLYAAFTSAREAQCLTLADLLKSGSEAPLHGLAEALLDLDGKVSVWRLKHLFVAVRTIGTGGIGTKGMPVQTLAHLLNHRLFTDLWDARAALAAAQY